jgi:hypothetical protein
LWNLSCFSLETVLLSVQDRCPVCANVPSAHKSFWSHPMVHLGARLKGKLAPFGDSVILMQYRCTVCVKYTIGLEIILDAPDGTPRQRGSCGISLLSIYT